MTVLFDERNGDVQSSYNNITSTCANYNGVGIPSAGNTIGGAVLTASNISNSGNWDVIVTDHNSSSTIPIYLVGIQILVFGIDLYGYFLATQQLIIVILVDKRLQQLLLL